MKISNNPTIFIGENIKKENQIKEGQHKKEERTDFFAGNLNQDLFENKLLEKKKEAREKAMKVVGEAFDADKLIDNDLQERKNKIAALEEENAKLQDQINEINDSQNALMEKYGITEDSQEQKDLELLRKKDKWMMGKGDALSEEEQEKAEKLEEKQKEKEAFIEKQKEKKEETEEVLENMPMEDMIHMGQLKDEIKQEVQKIVSEMKLVEEDIKGAMVDKSI